MARRNGGPRKGVEEKRRSLPIYHHYTLSPGKTKSHHPEAKCNHCLKEFVCGSKQRLIRHLRKCNSITNPEQIIAETLNTLARNSATGTLNHSILEASNLLPSQINQHLQHHQLISQQLHQNHQNNHQSPSPNISGSNNTNTTSIITNNSNNNNINNNDISNINHSNNNNGGPSSETSSHLVAGSANGPGQVSSVTVNILKRPAKRGRRPAGQFMTPRGSGITITTGLDGKTHFAPASQVPSVITSVSPVSGPVPIIAQIHNGRNTTALSYHQNSIPNSATGLNASTSGHMVCSTSNHHQAQSYKLNSEPIDRAYLKLVITRGLPISLCDTKEFQLWLKTFANDYKPPSSVNLITQNLKNEALAARQRISNVLVKAPKKTINLELHKWRDDFCGHLWYSIVACIDMKRFLISIKDIHSEISISSNNQARSMNGGLNSSKVLADFIDECIKRVGSDRINSLLIASSQDSDTLTSIARRSLYAAHPSIVAYHCWWHFTNQLCADIVEHNEVFRNLMRNSNLLINFIAERPRLAKIMEKFNPFLEVSGTIRHKKNDRRWYSHLVCYTLQYLKNNNEAITRIFDESVRLSHLPSDNNNNSSSGTNDHQQTGIPSAINSGSQQGPIILCHDDTDLLGVKSIVMSSEFWANLEISLSYLKPIHDIIALTSTISSTSATTSSETPATPFTPAICPVIASTLSLGEYMNWFLCYGKNLIEILKQNPDPIKQEIFTRYLYKFNSSIAELKLAIASYLLNPKYKCAFMTQKAKNLAIEEILNVASEFMPEESDGHTIFDQWKLYLVREEPYDVIYDESRSTPLEWWMSLPCAESIRRVALRILRLKAFTSPKPETLFSQLYFYEDEAKVSLGDSSYEDVAILRYFYDYEDKIGQHSLHGLAHGGTSSANAFPNSSQNGFHDRTQIGHLHTSNLNQSNFSSGCLDVSLEPNVQLDESLSISDGRQSFSDSFADVVVESYINNHHPDLNISTQPDIGNNSNSSIEELPAYKQFIQYIDYNDAGVQVIEEPTEKKKRKWTAQEILSKCQSNSQSTNAGWH